MYLHSAEEELPVETSNPPSWVLKLWFSSHNLTSPNNHCASAPDHKERLCLTFSKHYHTEPLWPELLPNERCGFSPQAPPQRPSHPAGLPAPLCGREPGAQEPLLGPGRHRKLHIPLWSRWVDRGQGFKPRRRGGGGTEYPRPLKNHPEVPHYCGTCLKPLDWTTALFSSTNIWEQAGTIHQVFKAKERAVGKGNIRRNKQQPWSEGQWWHVIILMLLLVGKC